MGRVKAVFPSKDGLVRSVEVKTGASSSLVRAFLVEIQGTLNIDIDIELSSCNL